MADPGGLAAAEVVLHFANRLEGHPVGQFDKEAAIAQMALIHFYRLAPAGQMACSAARPCTLPGTLVNSPGGLGVAAALKLTADAPASTMDKAALRQCSLVVFISFAP